MRKMKKKLLSFSFSYDNQSLDNIWNLVQPSSKPRFQIYLTY